ncbi:MAG: hypothetical protein IT170_02040 [Bryobacterales bacterium]|nr:hypothetical protein [Bryobacterales bacterium]
MNRRPTRLSFRTGLFAAVALVTVTAWPLSAQEKKADSGTAMQPGLADKEGQVQAVFIAISPYEVFPAVIHVKPGPFRLEIRNSLGGALPELQIETPSRQVTRSTAKRERFKSRDREIMELPAGEYTLRVKGASGLQCRLIVGARKQ